MKSLIVNADEENLDEVIEFVLGELEDLGLDNSVQMSFELAAEEIFVNIASYAYESGNGQAEIRTEVHEDPLSVEITFLDNGVPFNPLDAEDADTSLDALVEREGGLGIMMVKNYMDEVDYSYEDGKNILTLRKSINKE